MENACTGLTRSTISTTITRQPTSLLSPPLSRYQEEIDAANTMARMAQLANQNAEYNPNLSVALGVDQPTIVDSGSEGEWSD